MTSNVSSGVRVGAACLVAAAWQLGAISTATAQQPPPPPPGVLVPAPAAPAEPAGPTALTTPAMTGPLVANPNPSHLDADPFGTIYGSGFITGLGLFQTSPANYISGNNSANIDLSNAQFAVQKTDGLLQFYVQGGMYSYPAVGAPYFHVAKNTGDLFHGIPAAYAKVAPNDVFSVQAGVLPTLIGAEYASTFQNMNIERGLLWIQEPISSHGVQGNYTWGPVAFSLSLNDGFYSGDYNWISGSAAWTIDKANTLTLVGGGNFGRTSVVSFATPRPQANSTIINLIYTYNAAPWTITPYFQYTNVPSDSSLNLSGASTYGGAVLANYSFDDNWNMAGRFEYIGSSGGDNLLGYGSGSSALSFTLTPTYQQGVFFARAEGSVVSAFSTASGAVFGKDGNTTTQGRLVLETGIIF
jgi:hypothetical protein